MKSNVKIAPGLDELSILWEQRYFYVQAILYFQELHLDI